MYSLPSLTATMPSHFSLPTLPCLPCLLLLSVLSLPITSALSEDPDYSNDAGVYNYEYPEAEDDKSEEKVNETVSLGKVVIHSSKSHIEVDKDQLITLPCLMENPDNIQVIWSHIPPSGKGKAQIAIGEKILSEGRANVKVDTTGSTLLITKAKESDSGEYVCEVATGAQGPSLVHTVTVRGQGNGGVWQMVPCSLVLLLLAVMGLGLV